MTEQFTATVERRGPLAIIHLAGDITALAQAAMQRAYEQASSPAPHALVLSLGATDYINSAGIAILIGLVTQARRAGVPVRAAGLSDHFTRIWGMVGLTPYVDLYPTLPDALAL